MNNLEEIIRDSVRAENKRKMTKFLVIAVGLILVLTLSIMGFSAYFSAARRIGREWNIKLPSGLKLDFQADTVQFSNGIRYTAFHFNKMPKEAFLDSLVINENTANEESAQTTQKFKHSFETAMGSLDIPSEYLPNWDKQYYYIGITKITCAHENSQNDDYKFHMIFDSDSLRLIICERIIHPFVN